MQTPRETIYSTLFAKLQAMAGIKTATRRPAVYQSYAPEQMPALLLIQREEIPHKPKKGVSTMWELKVEVLMYVNIGSATQQETPATVINTLMDALEAVIEPDPVAEWAPHLGLNGVYSIKFDGPVDIHEGLEDQAEVVARLTIVAL